MKKIAVLVAMVLAGCSGEPDSPSWVKGAQMDIEQDIRWDTDGSADCKRLEFSERWFVMCKSGGKFGGLAYAVTEAANSRGVHCTASNRKGGSGGRLVQGIASGWRYGDGRCRGIESGL